jgi:hypothetical protein
MGGKYTPAPPPSYTRTSFTQLEMWKEMWTRRLRELVQDQYYIVIDCMRDYEKDKYRVGVKILNSDWSVHGIIEDDVDQLVHFPSETFKTQLIMLAG